MTLHIHAFNINYNVNNVFNVFVKRFLFIYMYEVE